MKKTLLILILLISKLAIAGGPSSLYNFNPNSLFFTSAINTTSTSQNVAYDIFVENGDNASVTITSSVGNFIPSYTNLSNLTISGLDATSVAFVFVSGPTPGTVTGTASFYIKGMFQTDPSSYLNVVSFIGVTPSINPSVTFNGFSMTVGGSNVNLTQSLISNSSGIKSFTVLGTAASLLGTNTLNAVSAGVVTVLGFIDASNLYNSTLVSAIVTINPAPPPVIPSITFTGTTLTVGGASIDLSTLFTSNSNGTKSFYISSGTSASLSGNNLTPLNEGSVTVTGNISSVAGFSASVQMAVFNVVAAPIVLMSPSIIFTGSTLTVGGASVDLSTLFTSNSNGTKSFSISSGTSASLSGNNLTPLNEGSVTVTGNISSIAGFNAGVQMAVFNVVAAPIIIINGNSDGFQNTSLSVYPNPTDGLFVIESSVAKTAEANITCLNGKIVWIGELTEGINTIDLRLPSGMYFLQVGKKVYKISIL